MSDEEEQEDEPTLMDDIEELVRRARKAADSPDNISMSDYSQMRAERHLWRVLGGLRGPDHIPDEDKYGDSKRHTTGRLRAIVTPHCGVVVRDSPLLKDEIQRRNKLLHECDGHFRSHFLDAMLSAKELGYDVPEEELHFST